MTDLSNDEADLLLLAVDRYAGDVLGPNLAPLQRECARWAEDAFPNDTVELRALGLAEEAGELCRAILKRAHGIRGTRAEWTAEIRKEAADVLATLLILASYEDFDLCDVTCAWFEHVARRELDHDPIGPLDPTVVVTERALDDMEQRLTLGGITGEERALVMRLARDALRMRSETARARGAGHRIPKEVRDFGGKRGHQPFVTGAVGPCPQDDCELGVVHYLNEDDTRVGCDSCAWEGWDEEILGNPRTGVEA